MGSGFGDLRQGFSIDLLSALKYPQEFVCMYIYICIHICLCKMFRVRTDGRALNDLDFWLSASGAPGCSGLLGGSGQL